MSAHIFAVLFTLGEHDDPNALLFPHHLPEVVCCVLHRALSQNVVPAHFFHRYKTGIDVVIISIAQLDTVLFVRKNVRITIPFHALCVKIQLQF